VSSSIHEELTREEARLKQMDDERAAVLKNISKLRTQLAAATSKSPANQQTAELSPEAKISLFRSLFKGREDVYPRMWLSKNGDPPFDIIEYLRHNALLNLGQP
jgi:hypothetical protein